MKRATRLSIAATMLTICAATLSTAHAKVIVDKQSNTVVVHTDQDTVRIEVCSDTVLHVVASPTGARAGTPKEPWMEKQCVPQPVELVQDSKTATIRTSSLRVQISLDIGWISIADANSKDLLREFDDTPRTYTPVIANGEKLLQVADRFHPATDEAFYGLGQHQSGQFNYRGDYVHLAQANADVDVPLVVSTKGYGILWNSAAVSDFDNRFPTEMKLTSDDADAIDYYFIYGPEMDQIIHQYRDMTGHAPLYGKWAYGLFQSKDRYKTEDELLEVAAKYRAERIPLDTIVQDWFWWTRKGSSEFNAGYPDVAGTTRKLHDEHFHLMISIWPSLEQGTPMEEQMRAKGYLVPGMLVYDATNPAARDLYWKLLPKTLLDRGFDAFWMDSAEPENGYLSDVVLAGVQLNIGNGARYANIFPLMHSMGVYQDWRQYTEQKRVYILTRSAFLGTQRNAATTWSGDTQSNFWAFTRQVPAGLNFMLSGIPYWTCDIGGYGNPDFPDTTNPAYQELYTRWFEYGTFNPIFRLHGHRSNNVNEIYAIDPIAPTLETFDKLRYRLLPYIYSLAWQVTSHDDTIMRPLVMDWRTEKKVWNIGDEFMFGRSILVNPVTQQGATSRQVYLPPAAAWYDFWTGAKLSGDQRLEAAAPLNRIPLYVKAGSIVPFGPAVEYVNQQPDAAIELRVYRGADASFTLYEDSGETYAYEKGMHAEIPIHWDDASGSLTLGARSGQFPEMTKSRKFNIVFVSEGHGAGPVETSLIDKETTYNGAEVTITAP